MLLRITLMTYTRIQTNLRRKRRLPTDMRRAVTQFDSENGRVGNNSTNACCRSAEIAGLDIAGLENEGLDNDGQILPDTR